jgi:hypothetical protein
MTRRFLTALGVMAVFAVAAGLVLRFVLGANGWPIPVVIVVSMLVSTGLFLLVGRRILWPAVSAPEPQQWNEDRL